MSETGYTVAIVDQGRAGTIEYREGALVLPLWWEFTMNGAYIWAPSPAQWDAYWQSNGATGAVGRRAEILERVAAAAIKQRAPSGRASVDDDGINLRF